jgi:hypothetical protein
MAESAPDTQVDKSEGPQETDAKRERSTIDFPYLGLDAAVEVAKAVHDVGGTKCQWDQLAAKLNQAAKGGGFRQRVMAAKTFGLLTYAQGIVSLTPLGSRLSDPAQEAAAKADAFLAVPLFSKVYEQFKGGVLPPAAGLETAMVALGVTPKQKDTARQVFHRSATEAGFFAYGPSRLVLPSFKPSSTPAPPKPSDEAKNGEVDHTRGKKNGNGGDGGNQHPLIEGLLKELPEPKTEWPMEERKNWLEMASTIFNVIYKNSDDSRGSLRVVVEKASAK